MIIHIIAIGTGGFFGSVARYLLSKFINEHFSSLPVGTLTVNVIGSLLLGFIVYSVSFGKTISPEIRDLMTIGFIGGFTTMSTFAYESFRLFELNELTMFALNVFLNILLSLLAVYLGRELAILLSK